MPVPTDATAASCPHVPRCEQFQSPYELCIRAVTGELQRLQALLVQLGAEDEKLKKNCGFAATPCGNNVSTDYERQFQPVAGVWEISTPAFFETECTSAINSRIEEPDGTADTPELVYTLNPSQVCEKINMKCTELDETQSCHTFPEIHERIVDPDFDEKGSMMGKVRTLSEYDEAKRLEALRISDDDSTDDDEPEDHKQLTCRKKLRRLVDSHVFEIVFAVALFTNTLFIGVEVDWSARYPQEGESSFFVAVGIFYGIVFTIELILRIGAHGCRFFIDPQNFFWNYLDLIIVSVSLYEYVLYIFVHVIGELEGGISGVSQVRAARLLRGARLMRFMRIARITRFVEALRTLVVSILGTLRSLFWSMLLLGLFIYTFAIAFTQSATDAVAWDIVLDDDKEALQHYWGNLLRAMLTLFASLSGGVSWEGPAWVIAKTGMHMIILYLVYLVFTYFAVLNVIVAVFVQSATESAQTDQDMIVKRKIGQRRAYIELARQLFRKVDKNGSGSINYRELQSVFDDEQVQAYFESLEIRIDCAWSLFKLLDDDEGHSIDLEEFVAGCLRLRGSARGLDLATMRSEHKYLSSQFHEHITALESTLGKILDQLPSVHESGPLRAVSPEGTAQKVTFAKL